MGDITATTILAALADETIHPDGHGIYPPEQYAPHFDVEAAGLVKTFVSDGTHKGSIFDGEGNVIPELKGVYNLMFLSWLATQKLGLPHSAAMGRGFAAQEYYRAIKAWAESETESVVLDFV